MILAQAVQAAEAVSPLYTYGPMGIITCWLMYRDERRATQVRETERHQFEQQSDVMHRIDGLTKAILVDLVNRDGVGAHTKAYAVATIAKIDARESIARNRVDKS